VSEPKRPVDAGFQAATMQARIGEGNQVLCRYSA